MAVSPTKLSAGQMGVGLTAAPPRDWAFLLTEANFYRSRDSITLQQRDEPYLPGSFVTSDGYAVDGVSGPGDPAVPAVPGDIDGIICAYTDCKAGPRMATIISRDAEVTDAYLMYGTLNVKNINQRLSALAIIVRQAVLPNIAGATFDPAVPGALVSGIPHSTPAIPPATLPYPQPASYFPSTLEAAEPDMPAAGSPQPAPPTVPQTFAASARLEGESDEDFAARQERERAEWERQRTESRGAAPSPPPEAPRT